MEIKWANSKLKQGRTAKELGCSGSIFQRYRQDINMLSPYIFPSNRNKRRQKT